MPHTASMKKFGTCNSIFKGERGYEIMTVETDIASGIFFFKIIGLADRMVQESQFRILSALRNSDFGVPQRRNEKVTVSLLPAHIKKVSTYSDLAIAVGYLIASGQIPDLEFPTAIIGQVGLDGSIGCDGDLSHFVRIALHHGIGHFIMPSGKLDDVAELDQDIRIACANHLTDIDGIRFETRKKNTPYASGTVQADNRSGGFAEFEIDSLSGIESHKRALQISVAGMHPILFSGMPGTGKSALAKCAPELMKDLSYEHADEVQAIHMNAQMPRREFYRPPIRTPHHHTTRIGMVGGMHNSSIGEISLAHRGVLLLDELCEFDRSTIESLREVFDQRGATVRKGSGQSFVPFEGLVIATTNLCPCGSSTSSSGATGNQRCRCTVPRKRQYQGRISNPILDRFHIKTVFCQDDQGRGRETDSEMTGAKIAESIRAAQEIQCHRNGPAGNPPNAYLTAKEVADFGISPGAAELLQAAEKSHSLPKRLIANALRVARTIADLESSDKIQEPHVLEALQYVKTNPFS